MSPMVKNRRRSLASPSLILGISRTSKTPLSIYLAYRGFKAANVPIIRDVEPPRVLRSMDSRKLVALNISPQKLVELRAARLVKLGLSPNETYADIDCIITIPTVGHYMMADPA